MLKMSRDRGGQLLQETRQRSDQQVHCLRRHRYQSSPFVFLFFATLYDVASWCVVVADRLAERVGGYEAYYP